jgi:hypothetical protein
MQTRDPTAHAPIGRQAAEDARRQIFDPPRRPRGRLGLGPAVEAIGQLPDRGVKFGGDRFEPAKRDPTEQRVITRHRYTLPAGTRTQHDPAAPAHAGDAQRIDRRP